MQITLLKNRNPAAVVLFISALMLVPIKSSAEPPPFSLPDPLQCGGLSFNIFNASTDFSSKELTQVLGYLFNTGDYKRIMEVADEWRNKECTLKDGQPELDYWLGGFSKAFKDEPDWRKSLSRIKELKDAYPNNGLASLAESRFWSDYAWNARGTGFASTVTEEGWALFKERLEKSEEILTSSKQEASKWPHWYWQMISVQTLLGCKNGACNKTFEEGVKRFNNSQPIYEALINYKLPKWGGSWSKVDAVVNFATKISTTKVRMRFTLTYICTSTTSFRPKANFL